MAGTKSRKAPVTFPHLSSPPISEVVCGFVFDPIPGIDLLELGVYWERRKERYPKKLVQPALMEGRLELSLGSPSMRVWLITEDDAFVLQLQNDRLILNWRARETDYPRFSDHDGGQGIMSRALSEFEDFSRYSEQRFNARPALKRVELAKVDLFWEGTHWDGFTDLNKLIPATRTFIPFCSSSFPEIQLRFNEVADDMQLHLSLMTVLSAEDRQKRGLRVESQAQLPATDVASVSRALVQANDRLNTVFFSIVGEAELKRFQ